MLLVLITTKSAEMTERNATSMTNFTKYFRKMMPSLQKHCAATLMVNGAKMQSRVLKIPVPHWVPQVVTQRSLWLQKQRKRSYQSGRKEKTSLGSLRNLHKTGKRKKRKRLKSLKICTMNAWHSSADFLMFLKNHWTKSNLDSIIFYCVAEHGIIWPQTWT